VKVFCGYFLQYANPVTSLFLPFFLIPVHGQVTDVGLCGFQAVRMEEGQIYDSISKYLQRST